MAERPADIVSPTSDHILPLKTSAEDAIAAGRVPYDKPTPANSVMLFIDHQIGLMVGVRDFTSLATYKANVIALGKMARALGIPALLSSSNAQWQNGETLPELKEIFDDQPIYRRTGIINCYEDPSFRSALERLLADTGRTHVIISGVTIGTCCSMPTLAMLNDGYRVFPVIDACGAWNSYEAEAAMARMSRAGGRAGHRVCAGLRAAGRLEAALRRRHVRTVHQRAARVRLRDPELLEQRKPARCQRSFGTVK